MARDKKNTLALFEVLRDGKEKGKSGSVLQTPKWWRRGPAIPQPPAATIAPSGLTIGAAASQATSPRQGVWFRLTSGHLVLGAVALVLIVGAAYWAGHGRRAPEMSRPTDVIKTDTANPGVLDVGHESVAGTAEQDPVTLAGQGRVTAGDGALAAGRTGSQDNGRVVGRNYIVVQSYFDVFSAGEARDHLAKAGIPCTVEKGLAFAPKRYCVVTLAGFEKVSSREYQECVKKIESVSNRLVSPKFLKFQPQAYSWR